MTTKVRLTIADLALLPDPLDDTRYELIDGELHVSKQPAWEHQYTAAACIHALRDWDLRTRAGVTLDAPGVIFSRDEAVAPDVVWTRSERFPDIVGADHRLHAAPDLIVEVLSPGAENLQRDRDLKLDLYSRHGVLEYWIVDWQARTVRVNRRESAWLRAATTLGSEDQLTSPLLPGFAAEVATLFPSI